MIVLSVKQPWAQLICAGVKNIENRTWRLPEKYKGKRVLIHASGKPWSWKQFCDYIEQLDNEDLELQKIIRENNFNEEWLKSLPTSSIIGSVTIVHCIINNSSIWAEKTKFMDSFGRSISPKRKEITYNWILHEPILFDKPIPNIKGRLGFWEYNKNIK